VNDHERDDEDDERDRDEDPEPEAELEDPPGQDAIVYFREARSFLDECCRMFGLHFVDAGQVVGELDPDVASALNLTAIECCRRMCRIMRDDLALDPDEIELGHA
jgi:hypothetical protein